MIRFLLFALAVFAAGIAAYGGGLWLMHHASSLTLVDATGKPDQQKILELIKLIPLAVAVLASIVTAGTSVLVAGLQWRGNKELERDKARYVVELTQLKARLDKELEDQRLEIGKDLEAERVRLALVKADADRRLGLLDRAQNAASTYVRALRKLDDGTFEHDEVEALDDELGLIRHDLHDGVLYELWCQFLAEGKYIQQRAEQRSTPKGWKELWREPHPDTREPLGLQFAARSRKVFTALREERHRVLGELASSSGRTRA